MPWNNRRGITLALAALAACMLGLWLGAIRHAHAEQSSAQPTLFQPHPRAEFLVIVDAGHGGDDTGAILAGKLLEKDLTLSLARQLKRELEDRGVTVRMLREFDVNLSLERRAEIANELRPSLYVALHAGAPGEGARVYAPSIPNLSEKPAGAFLPWESAQTASIGQSRTAAGTVTAGLRKAGLNVREMTTPLRPLNNIAAPAIAVEWATGPQGLRSPPAQRTEAGLASALATGIVHLRNQTEMRP